MIWKVVQSQIENKISYSNDDDINEEDKEEEEEDYPSYFYSPSTFF